jgi:hypothetical protein
MFSVSKSKFGWLDGTGQRLQDVDSEGRLSSSGRAGSAGIRALSEHQDSLKLAIPGGPHISESGTMVMEENKDETPTKELRMRARPDLASVTVARLPSWTRSP